MGMYEITSTANPVPTTEDQLFSVNNIVKVDNKMPMINYIGPF